MGQFFQDLRYALRRLRNAPRFTLAALSTLALGGWRQLSCLHAFSWHASSVASCPRTAAAISRGDRIPEVLKSGAFGSQLNDQ